MEKILSKKTAIFVAAFAVAFKSFLSAALELHPDEAYYWLWSKHLALGYYDHAPMVAYFIKLTTFLSNSEFFVRFSSILVTVFLSLLIWKFAKKLFDEKTAAASVIIVNTMPMLMSVSFIMTPDVPLFLFYALAVYFFYSLVKTRETKYWYVTGIFLGLALLSKYTAVLFVPCIFIYMLLDNKLYWFKSKHFYLMFVLAFAVFLPVVIWNWQHGWISFSYQLGHGVGSSPLTLRYLGEYFGGQLLVAGPFIFVFAVVASAAYLFSKDSKKLFLFSFSFPVVAFFAVTALKRLPYANWTAFAYFVFAVMVAQFMLAGNSRIKKKFLIAGIIFNVIVSLLLGLHEKYSIIPMERISHHAAIADTTNFLTGWKALGDKLKNLDVKYVVTYGHQYAALMAYYTQGKKEVLTDSPKTTQFSYWPAPQDLKTSKTAYVYVDIGGEENYSGLKDAEVFKVYRYGVPVRQYAVIVYDGYSRRY